MLPVYIKSDRNTERLEKGFKAIGLDPLILCPDEDFIKAVSVVARTGGMVEAIYLSDSTLGGPDDSFLDAVLAFRKLPDNLTFASGLKVKTLPIVLNVERVPERFFDSIERAGVTVLEPQYSVTVAKQDERLADFDGPDKSLPGKLASPASHVLTAIRRFKSELLEEFDNAGLAVAAEGGRLKIKIALTRSAVLETEHFFWPKELKPQVLFLSPDPVRLSQSLNNYEKLINKKDVTEREMQKFFELNPEFLLGNKFRKLWSQFVFPEDSEPQHRTDFLLEPKIYPQISANWEVLELKRPGDRLLTQSGLHRGFTQKVHRGIRQLRNYLERFSKNPEHLVRRLGQKVTHPRMALLIGKKLEADPETLARELKEFPDIRLVSYDEIQEEQMRRFEAVFSMNRLS